MPEREIDRAGERMGFQSREAAVRRKRRQPSEEPSDQINAFVEWCEANRYSYREGFARLIQRINRE